MASPLLALREIEERIAAQGRVNGDDLEVLRRMYGGKIDAKKRDYLAELYKRVRYRTPAFVQFFYDTIKNSILADGRVSAADAAWLRDVLFAGGKVEDEARTFLHRLKGEAREVSPEFEALFREVMKQPPEQHTAK